MKQKGLFAGMNTPLMIVFIMWAVFFLEHNVLHFSLGNFGIYPRSLTGIVGIFFSPFLHGDIFHLLSNTFPLLLLGGSLYFFYPKIAQKVFVMGFFLTNILVWLFARPYIHIGASGLVYAVAFFMVSFGFFKKSFKSIIISAIVLLFYGSMIYGVLPQGGNVSWEAHLMGAMVGIYAAVTLHKRYR